MVINGPVARAGSILNLSSKSGIIIPSREAKIIEEMSAMLMVYPSDEVLPIAIL